MVSLQAPLFTETSETHRMPTSQTYPNTTPVPTSKTDQSPFQRHKWWDVGTGSKNTLNNLRLIIQPYVSYCLLTPWLQVFEIPSLREGLLSLGTLMNGFQGFIPV